MPDAETWIRHFPAPAPPTTPWTVLFFPHSGGSAGSYQHLAARLSDAARTACVQYPGRAERRRDPPFTDVHALADQVADVLPRVCEDGPVLLFGHSLGAAVAYETALRTPDRTRTVLAVSGHPAPSRLRLPALALDSVDDGSTDPDEPLTALIRSLGGADADLLAHPVLRRMFLPVIRGDLKAHSRYRPTPDATVDCPVHALMGTEDPLTTPVDVQAWQHHTTSTLRVHELPGGHFFTNDHPEQVAHILLRVMGTDGDVGSGDRPTARP
jgi:surfactin synthase thioesterase subunit